MSTPRRVLAPLECSNNRVTSIESPSSHVGRRLQVQLERLAREDSLGVGRRLQVQLERLDSRGPPPQRANAVGPGHVGDSIATSRPSSRPIAVAPQRSRNNADATASPAASPSSSDSESSVDTVPLVETSASEAEEEEEEGAFQVCISGGDSNPWFIENSNGEQFWNGPTMLHGQVIPPCYVAPPSRGRRTCRASAAPTAVVSTVESPIIRNVEDQPLKRFAEAVGWGKPLSPPAKLKKMDD